MVDESEKALEVSTLLLQLLDRMEIIPNTAQAALGNSWVRLCIGMNFPPEHFKEIVSEMAVLYANLHKETYSGTENVT